jgi:hypothetical protein
MIDRVQVVVEAGQRHFARAQAAAIGQPPLDQQDVEPGACEIGGQDQPVMAGADHDAVVASVKCLGHASAPVCRGGHSAVRAGPRSIGLGARFLVGVGRSLTRYVARAEI